jgi:RNA polymerase sigma-70 factor (ECF subfamily)
MDSPPVKVPLDLQRYRAYLLVLARSQNNIAGEEASDIVQKTLLVAHHQREQFRGQTTGEMAAWLKQILRRQLIDAYRQQRRLRRDATREVPLEASIDGSFCRVEGWAAVHSTPSQLVSRDEELVRMAQALAQLPDAQREAIVLHHLQGTSLAEAAAKLDRTEAAVAGLLHRGLKQLRQMLDEGSQ